MHILIIPSWYPGTKFDVKGVFFRDQAMALSSYGHKVGVVAVNMRSLKTIFESRTNETQLVKREDEEGVATYRNLIWAALPRIPYGNYWLFKRAVQKLLREYIKHQGKPDIIHAHAAVFGGAVAVDLAKKFDIPVVLTEHSTGFARGVYLPWQLKLAEKVIAGSRSRISVSPSLGELLGDQFASNKILWKWIP